MDKDSLGMIGIRRRRRGGGGGGGGRNITCQSCDRASLHSHITKPETLSSVYYTGLQGEIDQKWQLLAPCLPRAELTRAQWTLLHVYLNSLCSSVWFYRKALLSGDIRPSANCIFFFFTREEEIESRGGFKTVQSCRKKEISSALFDLLYIVLYFSPLLYFSFLCADITKIIKKIHM